MTAIDALLDALPAWVLVGGKGGVGKTTCAVALAVRSAERGARTLLLSTDPAGTLADALGAPLTALPTPVPGQESLDGMQLDAIAARDAFLARWRETLAAIIDRGTYLDDEDITGLIDAALPGADEAMALLALADLATGGIWERIVIDTAPTGHTLRLLSLPRTFAALVELLDTMQAKHRFIVSALTHRYRADEADGFIAEMRGQIERLRALLLDPRGSAMVLLTRPESVVTSETVRYAAALRELGVRVAALVINAVPDVLDEDGVRALASLVDVGDASRFEVPRLTPPPMGVVATRVWGTALARVSPGREQRPSPEPRAEAGRSTADVGAGRGRARAVVSMRQLTIVGGKGGVGKTSAACALALDAADSVRVLLVSTDPAPSVADALAQPIGDAEVPVAGASRLTARQMDAEAAFERLRADYQERVDALFEGLVGRGLDAAHDRAVVRDLMTLAPPGIDELYALASLGETLADARFDLVVVDPAPTGHLLRLLEMPALALDWSHRLLRLMLKYREIVGLGETAGELLAFAKRTRAVQALLADPTRSGIFVVALDEPLVRGETARLLAAVTSRGMGVIGLLWNRTGGTPAPLSMPQDAPQFVSAAIMPPPTGVAALRRWRESWVPLTAVDG